MLLLLTSFVGTGKGVLLIVRQHVPRQVVLPAETLLASRKCALEWFL